MSFALGVTHIPPEAGAVQSGRMPPGVGPTPQLSTAVEEDSSMGYHAQAASTSDMLSRTPPAVAVAAAEADNNPSTAVAVCKILMQHSNSSGGSTPIIDHMAICKLLATSYALWPLVYYHYSGRLQLTLHARSPQQLQQFCCWFKRHAGLLRTLDLILPETPRQQKTPQPWVSKPSDHAKQSHRSEPVNVEAELAAAFVAAGRKAAAATLAATADEVAAMRLGPADTAEQQPRAMSTASTNDPSTCVGGQQAMCTIATAGDADIGMLHLEDFSCQSNLSLGSASIIIRSLRYCSNLSGLRLNVLCDDSTDSTLRDHTATTLGQLRSLTALQVTAHTDRRWGRADDAAFEGLLPHLSRLSSLKLSKIPRLDRYGDFKLLPVSLEKLQLDVYNLMSRDRTHLILTHLTALTELVIQGHNPLAAAIGASDELPNSLVVLSASDCPSATPLLPLKSLKELAISDSTAQAEETYRMSRALRSLTSVELSYSVAYDGPPLGAELPAAWATLPIRKLELHHGVPGVGVDMHLPALSHIGKLTQLTHLSLREGRNTFCIEAPPQQLGECLCQLTKLQDLVLFGVEVSRQPFDPVAEPELLYNPRLSLVAQAFDVLIDLTSLDFCMSVRNGYHHSHVPEPLELERQRADKLVVLKHIAALTQLRYLRLHTWHLADDSSLDELSGLQQLTTLKLWQHQFKLGSSTAYSAQLTHVPQSGLRTLMGKLHNLKLVELWVDPGCGRYQSRTCSTRIVPTRVLCYNL